MLFNSYAFLFGFLPLAVAGTFLLGRVHHRAGAAWLALASLAFYAVWDVRFLALLLVSIAFNFCAGLVIARARAAGEPARARRALILAIVVDLMVLATFKYASFLLTNLATLVPIPLLSAGAAHSIADSIVLPLGISFFTFTQMAFLVDAYRAEAREPDPLSYLLFVSYFPHLIAGPLLHHRQMMPQFARPSTFRPDLQNIAVGLGIFVLGLAKKLLVADNLALVANPVFHAAQAHEAVPILGAWSGALAYTLQLYFDFSGYSDMAIGLSLLFNVRLPLNFDSPLRAGNIIDFWRRWHMTLSAWLRHYLYIPLGGNRLGPRRRYVNLMITMLLGGLWHGAGWTFVLWGGLHGVYLMINHAWREWCQRRGWGDGGAAGRMLARGLTFLAVVVAFVFFRADSAQSAWTILCGMLDLAPSWASAGAIPDAISGNDDALGITRFIVPAALLIAWFCPSVHQMFAAYRPTWEDQEGVPTPAPVDGSTLARALRWKPRPVIALVQGGLLAFCVFFLMRVSEFLYFRF
jgi:D-alanyl-lipoteichoic acid acyltransferase DltB (MBOAT superfamily)